jgi:hypothetical protein
VTKDEFNRIQFSCELLDEWNNVLWEVDGLMLQQTGT